ncbi:LysR family transcriptional regulator [Shewanella surugensis]|uniref:LysR family transcriptional regulator n=1 Tax=Shewanella surugensis TaxID=212020 RepID=A0ABT0LDP1_9GAMM|nr:LysR family transcriptional regulator [Shewanella surugensis]MCL1125440.1 LysR family transcriptional regulator [Shewanella surugensis]
MKQDLNDMMAFLAVVETGSFTLAAERLAIPKANVSRKISRLEQRLNVTLLERSTRSQHLTEAGTRYLTHCKSIHEEIDLAEASVNEIIHLIKGPLKVGVSVTIGQQIIQPALSRFLSRYSDLNLQLLLLNERVNFIEEGYDLVIRVGKLDDSSLIARKLGTTQRKFFASPRYFSQSSIPEDINELLAHDLLLMSHLIKEEKLQLFSNKILHTMSIKPKLVINDFSLLKQMTIEGLGISILPEYMCQSELIDKTLIPLLPHWTMESVHLYVLYPKNRAKIPKINAFLDFISDLFKEKLTHI